MESHSTCYCGGRILEQIKCLKDSGMKDSGKNSTLPNHQIPFLNISQRLELVSHSSSLMVVFKCVKAVDANNVYPHDSWLMPRLR